MNVYYWYNGISFFTMLFVQKYWQYFVFLILSAIVYFPMFFNGFVWDDFDLLITNTQFHSLDVSLFFGNLLNSGYIYRQVMVLYYAVSYAIFGQHALPYHLVQLLLHVLATSLIFVLFRHYFKTSIAFFLSLFFLIHPINSETILWISSAQTIVYSIFGIAALLLVHKKNFSKQDMYFVVALLFLCLLSYELGIFYVILVVYYMRIRKLQFIKNVLLLVLGMVALYIVLRFVGYALDFTLIAGDEYMIKPTFVQKLYAMPSIISYYITTLFFPVTLVIWQTWIIRELSFGTVILPAVVILALCSCYLWLVFRNKAKNRLVLYFFTVWFFMGFVTLFHIFPPLEMTVADRWFYFPFIGLLGIIGFFVDKYWKKLKIYKNFLVVFLIIISCLYAGRSFVRSFDWKDEFTLYTHDLQLAPESAGLNYNVGHALAQQKKYQEAIPYFEKALRNTQRFVYGMTALGAAYEALGDYEKASVYYKQALFESKMPVLDTSFDLYYALANSLMKTKKYQELKLLLTDSIMSKSPHVVNLYVLRAEVNYELQDYDDAFKDAEFVYNYTDYPKREALYNRMKEARKEQVEPL